MFNPREQVTILLLILFALYALSLKSVRDSLPGLFKAFCKLVFHPIFIFVVFYIIMFFFLLYFFNIIGLELIKDYIIWILFGLFPLISKVSTSYLTINLKELFLSVFKLSVIPLFIMSEYTFPFLGELFLVPFSCFIGMMLVVASKDPKYRQVHKFLNYLSLFIGITIIVVALYGFLKNISDAQQIEFWEKMFIELIGITFHIPLLYFLKIICFYEQILIRTKIEKRVHKLLANIVIFRKCRLSTLKLTSTIKDHRLWNVTTTQELRRTLE